MSLRPLAVVVVAAGVLIAAAALARRGPTAPPNAPVSPAQPGDGAVERPPEFPPVTDDRDRIAHWVQILSSGDESYVDWAASRLRRVGDAGRRAVRDAGLASLESNVALVEQALEFLLVDPKDDDAPFARAALNVRDAEGVRQAMRLLASAPGADRPSAARAITDAALASDRKSRLEAAGALTKLGGDAGADEAVRLARAAAADEKAPIYSALADFRHEKIRAYLADAFATSTDTSDKVAAADALVAGGDPRPVAWLESIMSSPPPGPVDFGDLALAALAKAKHPGALRRIGAVVADAMEDPNRRIAMLERLAPYPLDAKLSYLEAAAAQVEGGGDEIRIEAYEALVRAGANGVLERLEAFVEKGDLRSANLAALVFGRVRLPEASRSLVAASRRTDVDEDTRTMCLRAVVLSGSPQDAEEPVRAMARDHAAYDARKSVAQNIASQFGEAKPAFKKAAGAALVRALDDAFGPLDGAGLVQVVLSTSVCCGEEAAPALARRLTHPDMPVRIAAAGALGYLASADTERDLRAAWWTSSDPAFREALGVAIERAHFRLPSARR